MIESFHIKKLRTLNLFPLTNKRYNYIQMVLLSNILIKKIKTNKNPNTFHGFKRHIFF